MEMELVICQDQTYYSYYQLLSYYRPGSSLSDTGYLPSRDSNIFASGIETQPVNQLRYHQFVASGTEPVQDCHMVSRNHQKSIVGKSM